MHHIRLRAHARATLTLGCKIYEGNSLMQAAAAVRRLIGFENRPRAHARGHGSKVLLLKITLL
jgi:hypothetical protein